MKKIICYTIIFAFLFQTSASLAQNESKDFEFSRGDGFRLLIYDQSGVASDNKILARLHDVEYFIDGDGYIRIGSLGLVKVAGLTIDETADALIEKFEYYVTDPQVVILPLIRVTLAGEFGSPGMYRFSPSMSFWDAVKEAGGLNSGSVENMYVIRDDVILYEDFPSALYKANSLQELGIQSGDQIIAPRVNRISFYTIMRYVQFGTSLILLYFAFLDRASN